MAETPIRTVRVSDTVWEAAKETAYQERDTITTVVLFALTAYARDPKAYKMAVGAITHRELMSAADLDAVVVALTGGAA